MKAAPTFSRFLMRGYPRPLFALGLRCSSPPTKDEGSAMIRAIVSACIIVSCFCFAPAAQAKGRHHHHRHHHSIHHHKAHRQHVARASHRHVARASQPHHAAVYAASGRPPECPPALWCGCYLATKMGFHGHTWRELWVARAWARIGSPAPHGCVDCVAVFSRRGGGHVGLVKSWENGNPVVLSGNYNNRVALATHSASRLVALRWIGQDHASLQ